MDVLVVLGILLAALLAFLVLASISGSLCFAVETFGMMGLVYWIFAMCTGIGAFCIISFGFIYWLDKMEKAKKEAK